MPSTTVVVTGARPTGLALACGLQAAGVAVRVLDKAPGPAMTSRALGLQPRGAEVLDRLGALGDLPERPVPIAHVLTYVDGSPLARLPVGQPTKLVTRPGLLMSQSEVEARLRDRLAALGVEVEWGRELLDVHQEVDEVVLRLGDGEQRAAWLVGCDGAHSRVRKAAGIGFPGVPVVERFLLADVTARLPIPRDSVAVWLRGDTMLGVFPLPGEDMWRLMAPAPTGSDAGPMTVLTELLQKEAGVPVSAVREVLWTSTFRIHRRLASSYRAGRILLAGDAAHIHSPFGGQGHEHRAGGCGEPRLEARPRRHRTFRGRLARLLRGGTQARRPRGPAVHERHDGHDSRTDCSGADPARSRVRTPAEPAFGAAPALGEVLSADPHLPKGPARRRPPPPRLGAGAGRPGTRPVLHSPGRHQHSPVRGTADRMGPPHTRRGQRRPRGGRPSAPWCGPRHHPHGCGGPAARHAGST